MINAITRIDHVAITVRDLDVSTQFYVDKLAGNVVGEYDIDGMLAIRQIILGGALLNLHRLGHSNPIVAGRPTPGSTDLCFGWDATIEGAIVFLDEAQIAIEIGPIETRGSDGARSDSVYFRDPDGNLLEFLVSSARVKRS